MWGQRQAQGETIVIRCHRLFDIPVTVLQSPSPKLVPVQRTCGQWTFGLWTEPWPELHEGSRGLHSLLRLGEEKVIKDNRFIT